MKKNLLLDIKNTVDNLRLAKPLVLNLTNVVTMDFMANALLAIGAAPLMAVADEEIEELVRISSAVNINIGTLDKNFVTRAMVAAKLAQLTKGKTPLVLDPVGAGASNLRTDAAVALLPLADIVRGNGSEIMAIGVTMGMTTGGQGKSQGVESTVEATDAKTVASTIAKKFANNKIIVVSGKEDVVTNGADSDLCAFGTPLMKSVTGMGCVLTAVMAAFAAVEKNHFAAARLAINFFALSGQVAAMTENNPASFKTRFIDMLHQPDWQKMEAIIDKA